MGEQAEIFVGLDVAKAKHAVAIAQEGPTGEVRYLGEIDTDPTSVRRMVAKLEKHGKRLHFCYEAGPTGHGLHSRYDDPRHACRPSRRKSNGSRESDTIASWQGVFQQPARRLKAS